MRLPEVIIRENLREQLDRGRALSLDADEVVQALLDEGWHFVSTPEWEQIDAPDGSLLRLHAIVDDTIIQDRRVLTRWVTESPQWLNAQRSELALNVVRAIGKKLGMGSAL